MGRRLTIGLAALAAVPLLYVGAYFLTVLRIEDDYPATTPRPPLVGYAVGGRAAEIMFRPIHTVDRKLRSQHWGHRRLADPYDSETFP